MFKSRSGVTPRTPKITSVALPDDDDYGTGRPSGLHTNSGFHYQQHPTTHSTQHRHREHERERKASEYGYHSDHAPRPRSDKMERFKNIFRGSDSHRRAETPQPRPTYRDGSFDSGRSRTLSSSSTSSAQPPKSILKQPKKLDDADKPRILGYRHAGKTYDRPINEIIMAAQRPAPQPVQPPPSRRQSGYQQQPQAFAWPAQQSDYIHPSSAPAPEAPIHVSLGGRGRSERHDSRPPRGSYHSHSQSYNQTPLHHPSSHPTTPAVAPQKPLQTSSSIKRHSSTHRTDKPYVEVPLKHEAIALSWLLVAYSHGSKRSNKPLVYFDIGFDPTIQLNVRIYRAGIGERLTQEEQETPASSHCKITKMTVVCKAFPQWPIRVERKEGIRCIDVFCAIYKTLHQPLRREDDIPRSMFDDKFHQAFRQRCKDSPGLTEYNEKKGPLRVDLLKGRRIFRGISSMGPDWQLDIDGRS